MIKLTGGIQIRSSTFTSTHSMPLLNVADVALKWGRCNFELVVSPVDSILKVFSNFKVALLGPYF